MSFKVEDLGKNSFKLTIEVGADEFDKALETAYNKNKGKIQVQGFRKGKAPRALIEKVYGAGVFYEDAANELIPDAYAAAAEESKLDIVSRPEIEVEQVEKGKNFIFTATVAVKPEVKLGKYKGVEVEKIPVEVSDAEVDAEIEKIREQNSRTITIDDRASQMGDIVRIDYEGFVDGVAFEGGKGSDYDLELGSHSFIDTFEDQLVGKNIGDQVEVNVTFPAEYHSEELKGKAAMFKVAVKEIKRKELPAADDDFAQDVSDFDTIKEYKADLKAKLIESKEREVKEAKENSVIEAIIEGAEMDIPQGMIDLQKRQMAEDFAQRMQQQGLSIEQYFKFTGMNPQQFMAEMEPRAIKNIQCRLVLEAVVKAENITVSDEELEKEFDEMAARYQMEKDKIKELVGDKERENMKMDIAVTKAIDLVRDAAVEKAAKAAKAPKAEKAEDAAEAAEAEKPAKKAPAKKAAPKAEDGAEAEKPAKKAAPKAKKTDVE